MSRYRLEEKFLQAESGAGSGYLRVSATHFLDLFVGVEDGKRALLLICDREPGEAPTMEALTVYRRKREDERWAFLVSLERKNLGGLFSYLAEDLVHSTENERDCVRAAACVVERLKWWTRLLSRARSGLLGEMELRGLVGELIFLRECAIPALGASAAVDGWVGQFDAPRDFRYADVDVEVKTHSRDSADIRISSAEQLDPAGVPIVLATIELDLVQADTAGSFSVDALVKHVRAACEPEANAVEGLDQRLWAAGYVPDPHYEKVYFRNSGPVLHLCGDGFPRLIRSELPAGITKCSYEIALAAMRGFRISEWRVQS